MSASQFSRLKLSSSLPRWSLHVIFVLSWVFPYSKIMHVILLGDSTLSIGVNVSVAASLSICVLRVPGVHHLSPKFRSYRQVGVQKNEWMHEFHRPKSTYSERFPLRLCFCTKTIVLSIKGAAFTYTHIIYTPEVCCANRWAVIGFNKAVIWHSRHHVSLA